ncbi:hypothetical protein BDM02DRAFT_3115941 [Thelephora ganbajun]|uniref:Uncharacterized protein n=1 Tax=Thelephora ganbajun TaxID=370292 RepID=A0ACB6ZEY5_THEGA|nr:hypothetical protein BDM02DRAFT_3115941 [Thelephora ganbajun]
MALPEAELSGRLNATTLTVRRSLRTLVTQTILSYNYGRASAFDEISTTRMSYVC